MLIKTGVPRQIYGIFFAGLLILGLYSLYFTDHGKEPDLTPRVEVPCNKCTYATFFCTRPENITTSTDPDPYFTATRMLNYQLLHQTWTKTQRKIPFLVMVPSYIPAEQIKTLESEGATIVAVKDVKSSINWVPEPSPPRCADQFTKLRIFELTKYDRILYLDADTLLMRPLDGIFDESISKMEFQTKTVFEVEEPNQREFQQRLPGSYAIVAGPDTMTSAHKIPVQERDEFNAGFFMLRPSLALFNYYQLVLNTPFSFEPRLMEQSLLNHVHRKKGSMPWMSFKPGVWNVNWPTTKDADSGTASLHDKFWDENSWSVDKELAGNYFATLGRMNNYWEQKHQSHVHI